MEKNFLCSVALRIAALHVADALLQLQQGGAVMSRSLASLRQDPFAESIHGARSAIDDKTSCTVLQTSAFVWNRVFALTVLHPTSYSSYLKIMRHTHATASL